MRNSNKLFLLIPTLLLVGCKSGENDSSKYDSILTSFQSGFKIKGTLNTTKKYYEDSDYKIPLDSKEQVKETYFIESIYQNNNGYVGVDRRYYKESNGTKKYLSGENAYNNKGYVALNYVDYDNVLQTDGYSMDDDYNELSYSASGLINPFLLINSTDISNDKLLNNYKANLFYSYIFAGISDKINTKLSIKKAEFSKDFDKLSVVFNEYKSTEYDNYDTFYITLNYDITFTFEDIGVANSKDAIQIEKNKVENEPLQKALNNMVNKNITISRKIVSYDKDAKVDAEETVITYNDGKDIYMQVFDSNLANNEVPTTPSKSDLYLKANNKKFLNTYTYTKDGENNDYIFNLDTGNYASINGYYYYSTFQPDFRINANIFNKNEDGSFSPTNDNLPYIGSDCFVPPLNTTIEISNGYITDMKIYVNEETDVSYISTILMEFDSNVYHGEITIDYRNVGKTTLPFNITIE